MIKKTLKISKKFYIYQKDRFPVFILAFSLFPAILSSGAITSSCPTFFEMSLALIASIAYLLHIRIIDEHRDFEHDNTHHIKRPVQAGVISKEELRYIDTLAVLILLGIGLSSGTSALVVVITMLGYSYLAGKEFFIGEKIRKYFFTYNAVNLFQMLLMQVFVYAIFANPLQVNKLLIAHFLFTTIGTIVFEFVRKLKIPGDDGSGKDTYTWYLGFKRSIVIYQILLLLNSLLFFWVATFISSNVVMLTSFAVGMVLLASLSTLIHSIKKTRQTDQLMQLSFLLLYGVFNIAIYFLSTT